MSFLGGKRVGLLAILGGVAAFYLFRKIATLKEKGSSFIVLLVLLAMINVSALNSIAISEYVYESLHTGTHIEEIMLGRYAMGLAINHVMDSQSTVELLVGFGAGSASDLADRILQGVVSLPHNDWLKIMFDYGILGSIVITISIALVF